MPLSLRLSVGVPPDTNTAALRFTVKVTTAPTLRSPVPAVIPGPVATTDVTVGPVGAGGVVVSICSPLNVVSTPERLAVWRDPLGAGAVACRTQVEPLLEYH